MPPFDALMGSDTLNTVVIGVLLYLALLWIAVILWVTKDITNRTNNLAFQIISISLVIFLTPLFGLVLYMIIRPSRTLVERYYEEIEQDLLEEWLAEYESNRSKDKKAAPSPVSPAPKPSSKADSLEKSAHSMHNPPVSPAKKARAPKA